MPSLQATILPIVIRYTRHGLDGLEQGLPLFIAHHRVSPFLYVLRKQPSEVGSQLNLEHSCLYIITQPERAASSSLNTHITKHFTNHRTTQHNPYLCFQRVDTTPNPLIKDIFFFCPLTAFLPILYTAVKCYTGMTCPLEETSQ